MQWSEVRKLYPDQWVLVEAVQSHYEGNNWCVEEVAIIRSLKDGREAMKELANAKGNRFVYHTLNEQIVMEVRIKPAIRRNIAHEN